MIIELPAIDVGSTTWAEFTAAERAGPHPQAQRIAELDATDEVAAVLAGG